MKLIIRSEQDRAEAHEFLANINIAKGFEFDCHPHDGVRTIEQNKLQRKWVGEASEQLGWEKEHVRSYCKLHFGVPILRADSDEFREKYDRIIRPLDYEQKLELMAVPFDFPVTRLMKVKQTIDYLDAMYVGLSGMGVILTEPKG